MSYHLRPHTSWVADASTAIAFIASSSIYLQSFTNILRLLSVTYIVLWLCGVSVGLRTRPRPSESGMRTLWPLAIYHGSGQLFTVLSLGTCLHQSNTQPSSSR